jgi:hypothetical protein
MHEFAVERIINAPPERIWKVLVDARALASGAFGIIRLEGRIALGEQLKLWSVVSPKRAFPLKVTGFDTNRSMVWSGGMPFGLFTGTRTFTLTPDGQGTRFAMREVYTGAMTGLIWSSIPDLTPSFEQFAVALAASVEPRA